MDNFNQVPETKLANVPYKYFSPTPKKKLERKQLLAESCSLCKNYYEQLEKDGQSRTQISCRHRTYHSRPKTPPHFFELDFHDYDIPISKHVSKPISENKYHAKKTILNMYHGLNVELIQHFTLEESESIFQDLEREIKYLPVNDCTVLINNVKVCKVPRKVAAYGDSNVTYSFSGKTYETKPWTPVLLKLRDVANQYTGEMYNFVMVNRYKDGKDYIGEHKDDEPDIKKKSNIVSFSFGTERLFIFKRNYYPNVDMTLAPGSVLIMKPPTNLYWKHTLPKQPHIKNVRINLTFRVMKSKEEKMKSI